LGLSFNRLMHNSSLRHFIIALSTHFILLLERLGIDLAIKPLKNLNCKKGKKNGWLRP